ncbi:MAG: flagellar basal body P-ring protein FlgI [Planctomycetales bacterium]|nr:flagellar basal body P-ring protein FlgI [Planctomycetales bacterium]
MMSRQSSKLRCQTALLLAGLLALAPAGCRSFIRGQSPLDDDNQHSADDDGVELIREVATPDGLSVLQVQGVGLVLNLPHTGSNPPPDALTESLLAEMRTHDVETPEKYISSDRTALVHVRALIPPGARDGDRVDVEVRIPQRSKTTDLSNGWLMMTRLSERAVLGNRVRTGRVLALAQGNVVVDSTFSGKAEKVYKVRGRILGGAQVQIDRPIGLRVREEYASPFKTTAVAQAINSRFHYHDRGTKRVVATPKDDVNITLEVPLQYRNNINRYLQVVRNVAIGETTPQRADRLKNLERMLHEPTTTALAAIRLEAIGDDATPILQTGLKSPNPEVNFASAEALAYLDVAEAAPALALAAKTERAFRWHALTALSTMDHVSAYDALAELLDDSSAEARYGAFRALRARNHRDPLYKGVLLGGEDREFLYHRVNSSGEPMIHFASTHSPEVVLFGMDQKMEPPAFVFAGEDIMLKGTPDGRIRVIRFQLGQDEEEMVVGTDLDQIIRGIAALGGNYSDIYHAITSAKQGGYLASRVVVNARASGNRTYQRDEQGSEPQSPTPELFADRLGERDDVERDHSDINPSGENSRKRRGFLGKILGSKDADEDSE